MFAALGALWLVHRLTAKGTTVEATATATAESTATAAVQVVLVPAGADGQALASLIGSRAYTVDAPLEVVEQSHQLVTDETTAQDALSAAVPSQKSRPARVPRSRT
ncbi:MAG: hypothetical protein JWP11_3812 [Frankiales bacterium]|nr:hypothetical protein [Frankiales bacterium]